MKVCHPWKTDGSCCNFMDHLVDYERSFMYVWTMPVFYMFQNVVEGIPTLDLRVLTNFLTTLTLLSTQIGLLKLLFTTFFSVVQL